MSLVTCNGAAVHEASITLPLVGIPTFILAMLEDDLPASEALEVRLGDELAWKATVRRKGADGAGRGTVQAVGGAGGMRQELAPKSYRQVPLRIPLADLVADAGEHLSGTCDAGTLGVELATWTRMGQSAFCALEALLEQAGSPSWRILADGTLWVGGESWPDSRIADWKVTSEAPHNGTLDLVALVPAVYPGEMFDGRRVVRVEHHVGPRRHFTWLHVEPATLGGTTLDRLKSAIEAVVRRVFSGIDYYASYPARVVGQNVDLTLELVPDDRRLLPTYSRVPIRFGVPGVSASVPAGARVLLGFASGDPTRPQAELWESASPTELVFGVGTNQPAALATALRTELDGIRAAITGHGITIGVPAQTIASSTVKVKV